MGTVSMAVQRLFDLRDRGDTTSTGRLRVDDSASAQRPGAMQPGMSMRGVLSFPYEFPKAGRYRIWVQAKRGGHVLTGSFVATVD